MSVKITLNAQLQISDFLASCLSPSRISLLLYSLLGSHFRPSKFATCKLSLSPALSWNSETIFLASQREDKEDGVGPVSGNETFLGGPRNGPES